LCQFPDTGLQVAGEEELDLDIIVKATQHLLCWGAQGIALFLREVEPGMKVGGGEIDKHQRQHPYEGLYPCPSVSSYQLPLLQVPACQIKKKKDNAYDIQEVADIHDAAADAAIVKIDAEHPDVIIESGAEGGQRADGAESAIEQEAGEGSHDKSHDG